MLNKIFVVIIFLGLSGCAKVQPEVSSYYDLNALLDQQAEILSSGYGLDKKVTMDGATESKVVTLDSSGWAEELSALREFSITEPAMVGSFEESTNGNTQRFDLKKDEKAVVRYFQIQETDGKALIQAQNLAEKTIYTDKKELTLTITDGVIEHYRITGFQKMIMKDTIYYEIAGQVLAK
ncbi:hypothetical protein [Marinoscillum sp. MHG1-6]|uniref:hypothetical protein n=1 Tax=Marinoscillum sp. MHG1-6 TaxID=2959627 RepID=UPI0021583EB8|nr:hypothetical protein [Marinoscillum sp. MHG1-6]